MANATGSIFNKNAEEKLRSPDDLDKYVRITNPSVWVVLMACLVLLAGLLVWGVFGTVSANVSATGVVVGDEALCFLNAENASKVHVNDAAVIHGEHMEVAEISATPRSRDEVKEMLGNDYLVSTLLDGDWAYVVRFSGGGDLAHGTPLDVTITTERVAPITLVLQTGAQGVQGLAG